MGKLLAVLVLMILLIQCSNNRPKQINHDFSIKINAINKASDDTLKDLNWKAHFYKFDLSLENNTDSTIHFWMMTCSWDDNFITNYQNVRIISPLVCDSNFPTIYDIDKNTKINFKGLITIKDSFDINKLIKIGFIYIKSNERDRLIELTPPPPGDSIQLKDHNTHNSIIWSDYFSI